MKVKPFIFSKISGTFKKVKAKVINYRGINLHLRKDYVYIGDKSKNWILTECSSGSMFAYGDTIKQTLFYADLLIECYGYEDIKELTKNIKAEQFDYMVKNLR